MPRHPPYALNSLTIKKLLSESVYLDTTFARASYQSYAIVKERIKQITRDEMVEVNGIEPMTSCLQGRRSPN
jgi:hypothetical protein